MYEVGDMLIDARGVEEDRAEGARWIRRAAETGEPRAIDFLRTNAWAREE